jgi:hypothetical protein
MGMLSKFWTDNSVLHVVLFWSCVRADLVCLSVAVNILSASILNKLISPTIPLSPARNVKPGILFSVVRGLVKLFILATATLIVSLSSILNLWRVSALCATTRY